MTQDDGAPARRRRRRSTSPQGAPATRPDELLPAVAPVRKPRHKAAAKAAAAASAAPRRASQARPKGTDRGLQELVGGGPSQLGPGRAMRAKDVNRPDAEDLARAERTLDIVHRNWRPQ